MMMMMMMMMMGTSPKIPNNPDTIDGMHICGYNEVDNDINKRNHDNEDGDKMDILKCHQTCLLENPRSSSMTFPAFKPPFSPRIFEPASFDDTRR